MHTKALRLAFALVFTPEINEFKFIAEIGQQACLYLSRS
jgi:hypothetical protein